MTFDVKIVTENLEDLYFQTKEVEASDNQSTYVVQ